MSLNRTGSRRNARRVSSMMRLEMLETRQLLATFTVLNTNDAGADSLRAAIAGVNASSDPTNLINFNISGSGVHTIDLASALDPIAKQVTLDGTNGNTTPSIELNGTGAGASADGLRVTGGASTITGLIINRFAGNGIVLSGFGGDTVTNSWIGVNNTDTAKSANGGDGILINNVPNNFIGGTTSAARNVISGNTGNGVHLTGAAAQNNVIQNNLIGTDLAGAANLGNGGDGVHIDTSSSNNSVGGVATNQANTIAFNTGSGVNVVSGTGNNIRRDSIFSNLVAGITLASGANGDQPAPTLTTATTSGGITTVSGTLTASPSSTYTVELFSNTTSTGQGRTYVGTTQVTTNASGVGTFSVATSTAVAVNQYISSTATSTTGNTSQFSGNIQNVAPTADLSIVGSATPEPVANGGYLVYTFTITNNGPNTASSVTFLDTLPANVSFVQAVATQGTITQSSGVITGTLGSLDANGVATVTVTVVPTSNGTLTNVGNVTATEDSTSTNNKATVTSTVVSGISLAVSATTNPPSPTVGTPLTFVFTVTNNGSTTATNVVLTSQLPTTPGVTFTSTSATQGTTTASNGIVTANLGSLAIGASAKVYVVFNPTATGTVTESATATGAEPEINTNTQTATATATVAAAPTPPAVVNGPIVTSLQRYGVHTQRTSIQLMFNQGLSASTAEDLANYTLVYAGRHPRRIRLQAARYDALTRSVVLTTRHPVNLHKLVQLTVNGSSSTGVASSDGVLLDGANNGKPGSNFIYAFKGLGPGVIG